MEILINIDVPDLDEGIRFYEDGLGLRLNRKLFSGTVAEMAGAGVRVYLLQKADGSEATKTVPGTRMYQRHWTPLHLDFVVKRIGPAVDRAVQAGAKLEKGPESFAWGSLATLSDPFGHGICLVEWKGRGYDEVA